MAGKHGPNRLSSYVQVHEAVTERLLRDGFVVHDSTVFTPLHDSILLEGRIECLGGLYVDVRKRLAILEGEGADAVVQNVYYSYDVVLRGVGNVFRYDSPHKTHNKEHHVHRFDVLSGDREGRVVFLPDESVRPTLGEVLREAEGWYYDHLDAPAPGAEEPRSDHRLPRIFSTVTTRSIAKTKAASRSVQLRLFARAVTSA